MNHNILFFLSFLVLIVIIFIIIFEFELKKWKCNDNKECVKVLGGDYSSKSKCNKRCKKIKKQSLSQSTPIESAPIFPSTYNCVNNECNLSKDGVYNSLSECKSDCPRTVIEQPIYYGYNYGLPYSPIYWGPRFRHRRRPRRRFINRRLMGPGLRGPGRRSPGRRS